MSLIAINNVDVVFGEKPKSIYKLLDAGVSREQIFQDTGHLVAVRNVSLSIKKGEIFVIMGLSGSGKSSLLRCINGLNKVSRGSVSFDGKPVAFNEDAYMQNLRRNRIAMVFQQFALLPWRTVAQNVGLGLEVTGMPKKEREDIIDNILEKVGLRDWKDKYPDGLSGGMKQRVGIARALATDADVLLMDEPFSALDPLTRAKLQKELLSIRDNFGKTIVFVTHDLTEAITIGNRIAIMEAGEVVQVDDPALVLHKPTTDYVSEFVKTIFETSKVAMRFEQQI